MRVPFELSYRLGEITLFKRRFAALTLTNHFFDLPTDLRIPPPPLERLARDSDVIVTLSHPVDAAPPKIRLAGGVLRYVPKYYTRYHAVLTGTFEEYLGKFGAKTRSTLRRKVRRFQEQAKSEAIRVYRSPAEMTEFLKLAREVSALTYQEKLLDAGLPADLAFGARLIELAKEDAVRGFLLHVESQPVAYLCCPIRNGVLLYSYLGYDPTHADASPGTVLQYLALEKLFQEGKFRALDFTEGEGEHKRFFSTTGTLCADVYYFPNTCTYRFWIALHAALDQISEVAGRILGRIGLKAVVKKWLRRR